MSSTMALARVCFAALVAVLAASSDARADQPVNPHYSEAFLETIVDAPKGRSISATRHAIHQSKINRSHKPKCDPERYDTEARNFNRVLPDLLLRGSLVMQATAKDAVQSLVYIPVVYHIIHNAAKVGFVPRPVLQNQINVLNQAYSGATHASSPDTGFRFLLAGVNYYTNNNWFQNCEAMERDLKTKTGILTANVLNVWTCNLADSGLGFATFPPSNGVPRWDEGIVLDHLVLPKTTGAKYSPMASYDLGDTLTHEVGHYLGLSHTFEGGCGNPGDEVADTPPERVPYYGGCSKGEKRNTCPSAGNDPIQNFMDYSMDKCMDRFTSGQVNRMKSLTSVGRPQLFRMTAPLRCAAQGPARGVGTAGELATCLTAKCVTTTMPDGNPSPPQGWCYTRGDSSLAGVNAWGTCCCPGTCPELFADSGFNAFPSNGGVAPSTFAPVSSSTIAPTVTQTSRPTTKNNRAPTKRPTRRPTNQPTKKTKAPTRAPTTKAPVQSSNGKAAAMPLLPEQCLLKRSWLKSSQACQARGGRLCTKNELAAGWLIPEVAKVPSCARILSSYVWTTRNCPKAMAWTAWGRDGSDWLCEKKTLKYMAACCSGTPGT